MPTPEWFAENPKISAYISKDLDNALKTWMEENRVKKISQALTQILNEYLGLVDAPKVIAEGQYATLEQLQKLQARVESLEKDSSSKKSESKPKTETKEQLAIGGIENSESEWLSTKKAHDRYGQSVSYDTFRKVSVERFRDDFGIEADPSRKAGPKPWLWLRKL